ncbi:MAG: hypothetical protein IMZ64_11025, partial [Bacteroidetes bacterium]|nr:hypothetical protein [Bacteroidota bacterium]
QLWNKEFDTLFDYTEDFLKFIQNSLPKEEQQRYFEGNVSAFFAIICRSIQEKVKTVTENGKTISLTNIKRAGTDTIKNHLNQMKKRPNLPNMPENFDKQVLNGRESIINKIIKDVFVKLPISKKNRQLLSEIAGLLFIKDIFPKNTSGVVVAGYGKKDDFPSIIQLTIHGVVDNIVKYRIEQKENITFENNAIIMPFAQKEMVSTFMEGVNPIYEQMVNGVLSQILNEYPKILLQNISQIQVQEQEKMLAVLLKIGVKMKSEIIQMFDNYKLKEFISPILGAVGALPKDELATMAETLVNLTSFKRKMSLDAETVGGPIDVAVISKGDGFVWIKHKHYFDPELNHHFFKNYFGKPEGEEES